MTSGSWESGYGRRRDEQPRTPPALHCCCCCAVDDDDDDDDADDSHTSRDEAVGSSQARNVDDTAADKKPSIIQFNYCNGHSDN